jgi:hypothetical protein
LLSVLAGDVFRKIGIGPSLLAFKALYYAVSLKNLKRTMMAARNRKKNIQPVDLQGGMHN